MPTRGPSEHSIQVQICEWLDFCRVLYMSIANGAHLAGDRRRKAIQMNKLKAEGLQVGIPDMMIITPPPTDPGSRVWVEAKTQTGSLSREQREWHRILPDSQLEVWEGVGHMPWLEVPERFFDRVNGFLAG